MYLGQSKSFDDRLKLKVNGFSFEDSFSNAYAVQKGITYSRIGAWKLGGLTKETQSQFSVNNVYTGPLEAAEVFRIIDSSSLQVAPRGINGEIEVSLLLSDRVKEINNNEICVNDVAKYIDKAFCSIEFPYSFWKFPNDGVYKLIADCCAAGSLIIGAEIDEFNLSNHYQPVVRNLNGEILLSGHTHHLIGGLENTLYQFLMTVKKYGLEISPAQYVATGGISSCVELPIGECLSLDLISKDSNSNNFILSKGK